MAECKRPVLLDNQLNEINILYPQKAQLNLNMTGVSDCQLTLPFDAPAIQMHQWVKVFNQNGLVGYFRRTANSQSIPSDRSVTLRHGIDILQDSLWEEETEFNGTTVGFLEAVLAHQSALINGQRPWTLGTCDASTEVEGKKINYNKLSDLLASLEDQTGEYYFAYDMSVFPWRLSYVRKDSTVMSEFRLSRNLTKIKITENDSELCTKLILHANRTISITDEDGNTREENQRTTYTYNNEDAQALYGIVTKTTDIDLADHPEGAAAYADRFLSERDHPQLQIQADGYDLKALSGFDWDEQHLGRMCRVAIPDYATYFTERVITVKYPSLLDQPSVVQVSLASALPKLTHTAAKIERESVERATQERELSREVKETKSTSALNLIRTDTAGNIFRQAGLVIDPSGVLIFAKEGKFGQKFAQIDVRADSIESTVQNTAEGLHSEITQTATEIRSEVANDVDGLNSTISQTASEIRLEVSNDIEGVTSQIIQTAEAVEINARDIKLIADNYVSVNKLETELEAVKSSYADQVTTDLLQAEVAHAGELTADSSFYVYNTFVRWCRVWRNGQEETTFLGTSDLYL